MKLLITGGAGFIGSNVIKFLIKNHEITTIDNLSTGFKRNIPTGTKTIIGDCGNEVLIDNINEKFDIIIHIQQIYFLLVLYVRKLYNQVVTIKRRDAKVQNKER